MFQKKKKKTNKILYWESLTTDIAVAREKGSVCIYVSAMEEEEDWLWDFVGNNDYKCHPSHITDGIQYWKIKF